MLRLRCVKILSKLEGVYLRSAPIGLYVIWIQVRQAFTNVFVNSYYSYDMDSFLEITVRAITRQKGRALQWPASAAE